MVSPSIFWILLTLWIPSILSYPDTFLCNPGWSYFPITGACYGASELPPRNNWETGESYCQKYGAHLATFQSQEEFNHVLSYFYVSWDNVWTGYFSMDGENWQSADGKGVDPFKYAKWCSNGYPWKISGKNCLGFGGVNNVEHCFHNHDCGNAYHMRTICKKQIF